jgi:hypothetical protein
MNKITNDNIRYQLQNLRQLVFEVTDRCNFNPNCMIRISGSK